MARWPGVALSVGVVAAACTGGDVRVDEPVVTIFDDGDILEEDEADDGAPTSADETIESTTTVPVADRLAPLADDVVGVVRSVTGAALAIEGTDGENWLVIGPCGGRTAVDAVTATVLGPQHVVLDPGHGGADRGAVGDVGLDEADLNLDVAQRVAVRLRAEGVSVLLTRETDVSMNASSRAAAARATGAMALVSIHHSDVVGAPSPGPGTEAWYQVDDPESRRLAGVVYEEVTAALAQFEIGWRSPDEPGVKYLLNQRGADFHTVLRDSVDTPALFIELALLSNPDEAALLAGEEGRQAEADAVATGIVRFLVDRDEGRGFIEPDERVRAAETTSAGGCESAAD